MTRRAVVAGMIGTFPVGGVVWDYGQYLLGLDSLGFEVWYLEDTGAWSYDAAAGAYEPSGRYGAAFLEQELVALLPSMAGRWHFRSADGTRFGIEESQVLDVLAEADVFLNVSGGTILRPGYRACRRTVFIDTDPGWNHFVVLPRADAEAGDEPAPFRAHDAFFTYALRIRTAGCSLPTLGLEWQPTVPPVALDRWAPDPPGAAWTTVLSWDNYGAPIVVGDRRYGSKAEEFDKVLGLPVRVAVPFELAIGGADPPLATLTGAGWGLVDGPAATRTAADYRGFVQRSRGEVSVAKQVYVGTRSGWFSCRSVCYLAAGHPVVLQDTGYSSVLACGDGIVPFVSGEDAVAALQRVEADFEGHAAAARRHAEETFAAELVVADLLDHAGVS